MAKPVQIERGSSVEVCVLLLLLLLYNAIVNKQSYAKASKRERRGRRRVTPGGGGQRNIKGHRHRAFLNLVKMLRESEARDANVAAAAVGERPRRGHPAKAMETVPRG